MKMTAQKTKRILWVICVWLGSLSIGLYVRLYPFFYQTDNTLYDKATLLVVSRLKKTAADNIMRLFPDKNNLQKLSLSKEYFDHILHKKKEKVQKAIRSVYRDLARREPAAKQATYLLASDSYYYLGLTQNILKTGRLGDQTKGRKFFNPLTLAPRGDWKPITLHPYLGVLVYRTLKFFVPHISLMKALSFTPLLITVLTSLAFWGILSLLRCSLPTKFLGNTFLLIAPIFAKRSAFGWYDNDPYNLLFPFLILSIFFLGLQRRSNIRENIFIGMIGSFTCVLYAFFWHGWVFFLAILLSSGILILIFNHFVAGKKQETKSLSLFLAGFPFWTTAGFVVFFGWRDFLSFFKEGTEALRNFLEPQLILWPDILINVGELKKISFPSLIHMNGGWTFFLVALIGSTVYGTQAIRRKKDNDLFRFIVLFLTTVSSAVIALLAQRFALLFLIPLSIFFTLGIGYLLTFTKERISRLPMKAHKQKISYTVLVGFLLICIFAPGLATCHKQMLSWRPIFNQTWDEVLTTLRKKTPAESIIETWWPPGHFITAIAQRRVLFDGGTINVPQGYWMASVFLNQNERQAAGILRMLNNSGNEAADYLQSQGLPLSWIVRKLKAITALNKTQAKNLLTDRLSETQIRHLLKLTHSRPPPSYILVYNELIEKNLEFSFVGKWNFKKIEKIIQGESTVKIPARNSKSYIDFLWNLMGGALKSSEILSQLAAHGQIVVFDQGVSVDLDQMACVINSRKFGKGTPRHLIYFNGDQTVEKTLKDANLNISVLVVKDGPIHRCMLLDQALAKSLLFRLYFLKGKGLTYFQPFVEKTDLTGRTHIFVFRVDWKKFLKDIGED